VGLEAYWGNKGKPNSGMDAFQEILRVRQNRPFAPHKHLWAITRLGVQLKLEALNVLTALKAELLGATALELVETVVMPSEPESRDSISDVAGAHRAAVKTSEVATRRQSDSQIGKDKGSSMRHARVRNRAWQRACQRGEFFTRRWS
jgi:hypothetical protein